MSLYKEPLDPDIYQELNDGSDRSVAIVGAGIVEYALARALICLMRPLSMARKRTIFTGYGPLASFSAKIEIGFALKLFGERTRTELARVKDIRNKFAHEVSPGWSFEHEDVRRICDAFSLIDEKAAPILPRLNVREFMERQNHPRQRFLLTVGLLSTQLEGESMEFAFRRKQLPESSFLAE